MTIEDLMGILQSKAEDLDLYDFNAEVTFSIGDADENSICVDKENRICIRIE